MYACKRRQRNFRRIRESTRPNQPTNPSKRHRERLNGELETVASLLPYDDATIQRLDKLSVLRLAVSFVQIKAHFALFLRQQHNGGGEPPSLASLAAPNAMFSALSASSIPISPIPTMLTPQGLPSYDIIESNFSQLALKSVGGFVIALSEWGDIYYVSENIDQYLGFCQSDVLHQSITDLLHSEDRENILKALKVQKPKMKGISAVENSTKIEYDTMERIVMGRFRCLLDNTCGFVRMEIRGKFLRLNALANPSEDTVPSKDKSKFMTTPYALAAICTPFVPPVHLEQTTEDPILKTKHGLDLSFLCIDSRLRNILEIDESVKSGGLSFYQFIHPDDVKCLSECHEETRKNGSSALLVIRLISTKSQIIYFFQSSFRLFYKSGKPESIGITHRYLTEVDGISLLEKRGTVKGSIFTHDEPSLQSPRTLSTAQNLTPLLIKEEDDDDEKSFEQPLLKPKRVVTEKTNATTKKMSAKMRNNNNNAHNNYVSTSASMSTNPLGAISCLEELVKASTSTLYPTTTKGLKIKKNNMAKNQQHENFAIQNHEIDQLPTLSDVFPQYLNPSTDFQQQHAPAQYPHPWPMTDGNSTFDFSAYYHNHHHHQMAHGYSHPHNPNDYASFNGWFQDSSNAGGFFSADQINGYYAAAAHQHQYYPEPLPKQIIPPPSHPPTTVPSTTDVATAISQPQQPPPPPLPTVFFPEQQIQNSEDGNFFNQKFTLPALSTFQTGKHDGIETSNNFSFLNEVAHTLFGQ